MKASTGRVTGTIFLVLSYFVIDFYCRGDNNYRSKSKKYFLLGSISVVIAFLFYFLRIISSLSHIGKLDVTVLEKLKELIKYDSLISFSVERGNLPNIPILMKLIDSWNNEGVPLLGKTIINPIINFLPSSIRPLPISYQPAWMIKELWYLHIQGGSLPPTGIGAMYMNFNILGPTIGMFLFGVFCAIFYNLLIKKRNYWILIIYSQILLSFITLYPKSNIDNLNLWHIVPTIMILIILSMIGIVCKKDKTDFDANTHTDK